MILMRAFHKPLPLRIGPEIPITSTVTFTVNLLLVVALKIICSCSSQPFALKLRYWLSRAWLDMTTRFVIRTFLLSSCVFSEAGASKVITKITRLLLTVAKKQNKTKQALKSIFSVKSVKLLSTLGKVSFQWKFFRMLSQCWVAL